MPEPLKVLRRLEQQALAILVVVVGGHIRTVTPISSQENGESSDVRDESQERHVRMTLLVGQIENVNLIEKSQ
jgi:hypothetical protein